MSKLRQLGTQPFLAGVLICGNQRDGHQINSRRSGQTGHEAADQIRQENFAIELI
jgi:hypothetical protein